MEIGLLEILLILVATVLNLLNLSLSETPDFRALVSSLISDVNLSIASELPSIYLVALPKFVSLSVSELLINEVPAVTTFFIASCGFSLALLIVL